MWAEDYRRMSDDELIDFFENIYDNFEVKEVLPYRFGRLINCKKQKTIDLNNRRRFGDDGYEFETFYRKYRMLHSHLAGEKNDNHQFIIGNYQEENVALKFSDYNLYLFYDAEIDMINT